ncbi:hypothetical protein AZF37_03955 [endosymbiont 'TC1' of Trimyema compressum]|nr:tyrosine-protein phosphatase [endosymbiont 'TC1' of Trimyema compressum]AMP20437.1 hypothetical protein AZF37_03955 [endosymbiont 'TC1' of Trimyema compressum]
MKSKNILLDIDLRSQSEIDKNIDRLKGVKGMAYASISLLSIFEDQIKDLSKADFSKIPKSLGEFYIMVLHYCQEGFREVFKLIGSREEAAILFHCSVGKDRTGLIAALLLNLVGVSDKVIVEDYAYSGENIGPVIKKYENMNEEYLKPFLVAGPEAMETFLSELNRTYGNSEGFLKHLGLSNKVIQNIQGTFV